MSEPVEGAEPMGLTIDCDTCVMKESSACGDCVVSFLLDRPAGAIVFDAGEERALRAMSRAGLLPIVRYEPMDEAAGGA